MAVGVLFGAVKAGLFVLRPYDFFHGSDRTEALGGMDSGRHKQRNYLLHRTKDSAVGFYSRKLVLYRALCR
jgi:hypothetical protein